MPSPKFIVKPASRSGSTTSKQRLTARELRELASRISQVDPQLAKEARQKAQARVPTFLNKVFKVVDVPRKETFRTIFGEEGPKTGAEFLKKEIFPDDDRASKIARGVGGFAVDVALDPTTYLTAGVGGLGRAATKQAIASNIAKQAGFDLPQLIKQGGPKAVLAEPKLKLLHSLFEEGGASTVSQIWRTLPRDVYDKLPTHLQGGVRVRLGLRPGKSKEIQLIPGRITSKVTGPISAKLKKRAGPVLEAITFGEKASKSFEGHLAIRTLREARDIQSGLERDFTNALSIAEKEFPRNDPEAVRKLFEGLWTPESLDVAKYTSEQQGVVIGLRSVLEDTLGKAQLSGINIKRLGAYAPRAISREGTIAKYGVDLGARAKPSGIPGVSKARQKVFKEDFRAAQKELSEWYGLDGKDLKFFTENPYEALGVYFKRMSKDIAEHGWAKQIKEAGIGLSSINRTTSGIWEQDLRQAGFGSATPVREALQAAEKEIQGIADPRLKEVNARSLGPLRNQAAERLGSKEASLEKATKGALKKRGQVQDELVRGLRLGERMYSRSARLSELGRKTEGAVDLAESSARKSEDFLESARALQLSGPVRQFVAGHSKVVGQLARQQKRVERTTQQLEKLTSLRDQIRASNAGPIKAELKTVRTQLQKIESVFQRNAAEIKLGRDPVLDANAGQAFQSKYQELASTAEKLEKQIKGAQAGAPKTKASLKEVEFKIKKLSSIKEASEKELEGLEQFAKTQDPKHLADGELKGLVTRAMEREGKRVAKDIDKAEKQVTSLTAKGIRAEESAEKLQQRIVREQEFLARDAAKDERLQLQLEKDYEGLNGLLNKMENLEVGKRPSGKDWPAPKLHRGAPPKGHAKVDGTVIGAINGTWVPEHLAAELNQSLRVANVNLLWKYFDSFTRHFKFWVTIPFPAFHMRNAIGAGTNHYIVGGTVSDLKIAQDIVRGRIPDGQIFEQFGGRTAGEIKEYLTTYKIFHPKLAAQLAELIEESPVGILGKYAGKAEKGIRKAYGDKATEFIEGFFRTGTFMTGLRQTDDPYAARLLVMRTHGDYSELTASERSIGRLIPFYRWTRTNVPLQLQNIMENPGRFMAIERFQRGVVGDPEAQEEFEKQGFIPDFLAKRGAVAAGPLVPSFLRGTPEEPSYVSLDLPTADVNEFVTPSGLPNLQGVLAASNPLVKGFVEGVMKRRVFSGGDIRPMIPASGAMLPLGKLLESNPVTKGLTARAKGGELLVSSNVELILQSLPTSRISAQTRDIWPSQTTLDKSTTAQKLADFSGIRFSPMTREGQSAQLNVRNKQLEELIAELYRREFGEDFKAAKNKTQATSTRKTKRGNRYPKVSIAPPSRSRSR